MKRKKLLWLLLPVTVCLLMEGERKISGSKTAVHESAPETVARQETDGTRETDASSLQMPTEAKPSNSPQAESSARPRSESISTSTLKPKPESLGQPKAQLSSQLELDERQPAAETPNESPKASEEGSASVEDHEESGIFFEPDDRSSPDDPNEPDVQEQTEASEEPETPEIQSEEEAAPEPVLSCEETGHAWGAEMDVFGDGTMFRKECSLCGAWEKRTAVFSDPVEFWWLQWTDEEGNLQRREFETYEECREAEEELEGAWNFGNDYREELMRWEITSSEGYRYTTE